MAKFFITGGAGFIGSHIAALALDEGHDVIVLDNLSTGKLENIALLRAHPKFTFIEKDICDPESYYDNLMSVDHVIHCAARISVAESMDYPERYEATNVAGTKALLDASIAAGVKSFVLSSSAAIYGDNPVLPKTEDMQPEPKSPYADSKLAGEKLLVEAMANHPIRTTSLRYFNVFGPKQDPKSHYAAAIPHFIDQAIAQAPITIFGDGQQTRDFVYVEDVARANMYAALEGSGVINVAQGKSTTILALAEKIRDQLASSSVIGFAEERPGDIKHSLADCSQLFKQWPQLQSDQFDAHLATTIHYYKDYKG